VTAVCPVDPKHRAFRASGSGEIACVDCQAVSKAKRNKYNAKKVDTPLGRADSVKEGKRLEALRLMQAAGEITDLIAHPSFDLIAWSPAGPRIIGRYTADAAYRENGRLDGRGHQIRGHPQASGLQPAPPRVPREPSRNRARET
jgi:hypothetical protein